MDLDFSPPTAQSSSHRQWRSALKVSVLRHVGLFCAAWMGCALATKADVEKLTFLHTQGEDIVNEQGEKVMLRGVGLGNWFLPEGYMWKFGENGDRPRKIEKIVRDLIGTEEAAKFWTTFRNNYVTESDIQRLAQLGYNSVRPALNSRLFMKDGAVDEQAEGFQLLDRLVERCKAHGVYVIIDMHAAPGGQTGQNIDDSEANEPLLFMEPKYQDQLNALWQTLAKRYAGEPAVAGYDLLNEPLPQRTGAADKYKSQLEPLYKRLTKTIREVDPRHMVIVEGADWANDWSVFTGPFDANMVYQFHYYCWDTPSTLKSISHYLDHRKKWHAPIWVGETGERDNTIYWATTDYFEANNIGWAFWPWKKMDTRNTPCSIKPPAGWEAIVAYSRGGAKPSAEAARKAFAELAENVRMENCTFFPDVVNSMLRLAPARVEAENFSHGGLNDSYYVKDATYRSKQYRSSEGVPISSRTMGRRQSEQSVHLTASEWTCYTVRSRGPADFALQIRAKSSGGPSEVQLSVGEQVRTVTLSEPNWTSIDAGTVSLAQGTNCLRCLVKSGAVDVDWMELSTKTKPTVSAELDSPKSKKMD